MEYRDLLGWLPWVANAPQVYELYRCETCHLVFTTCYPSHTIQMVETSECYEEKVIAPYLAAMQPLVDDDLARVVEQGGDDLPVQQRHWHALLKVIQRNVPPNPRIAEVGSCYGAFAALMQRILSPSHLLACEANEKFLSRLKVRYPEIDTTPALIEKWPGNSRFNLIYCSDVIEHIWNFHSFLKTAADRLVDGGCLVVVTPNIECSAAEEAGLKWWGYLVPHHCQLFSAKALGAAGRAAGLQMTESAPSFEELIVVFHKRTLRS